MARPRLLSAETQVPVKAGERKPGRRESMLAAVRLVRLIGNDYEANEFWYCNGVGDIRPRGCCGKLVHTSPLVKHADAEGRGPELGDGGAMGLLHIRAAGHAEARHARDGLKHQGVP